ncbi:helix-turn-helix domain-containing protein [Sphaerisporangium dianthi]|uniref:Multiprotein-bridging factor 1 family protein n=1 Tax=Sphaerisporangium dianthi TaxID=1436120 RepID=A0ABV9CH33_9ACTN
MRDLPPTEVPAFTPKPSPPRAGRAPARPAFSHGASPHRPEASDATNDSTGPALGLGQRIRHLRERRDMTREVLAGLIGKPASWPKQVESGRLRP